MTKFVARRTRRAVQVAVLVALVALGVLGTAGEASAEAGAVVVGGAVSERERGLIQSAVESTTRDAGWGLPAKPFTTKEAEGLLQCKDTSSPWTCIPPTRRKEGLHRVLVVSAEHDENQNGTPIIVLTSTLIAADPQAVVVLQRYCEYCADDKLIATARELTRLVLRDHAVRDGRTVLDVSSQPPGATIKLDGVQIGITDGKFPTYPGPHVLTLEKAGHRAETQEIEVTENQTASVAVTLQPLSVASPKDPAPRDAPPSRLIPGLVMGAGVGVIVAGIVVFALDEDVEVAGPQQEHYFDSAGLGVATIVAGALITGGGAYLWMRTAKRRTAPAVSLLPGGGTVGWKGSF